MSQVDAPTLTTDDGIRYIPIRWLCDLLGLAPAPWIAVICTHSRKKTEVIVRAQRPDEHYKSARPSHMPLRRLLYPAVPSADSSNQVVSTNPLIQPTRTDQLEWCLESGQMMNWLTFHLDTDRIPDMQRRKQVHTLQQQALAAVSEEYVRLQTEFRSVKRFLRQRLRQSVRMVMSFDELRKQALAHLKQRTLDPDERREEQLAFTGTLAQGRLLYSELTDALRTALHAMSDVPIVDAFRVEPTGAIMEVTAMPILPILPNLSDVYRCLDAAAWKLEQDLLSWMSTQGLNYPAQKRNAGASNAPLANEQQ